MTRKRICETLEGNVNRRDYFQIYTYMQNKHFLFYVKEYSKHLERTVEKHLPCRQKAFLVSVHEKLIFSHYVANRQHQELTVITTHESQPKFILSMICGKNSDISFDI